MIGLAVVLVRTCSNEFRDGLRRSTFVQSGHPPLGRGGWTHANDQAVLSVEVDLQPIEPVDLVGCPIYEIATRQDGSVAFAL